MNRTGLAIALAVAIVIGGLFAVYPELDLAISRVFHSELGFTLSADRTLVLVRRYAMVLVALLALPAFLAIPIKLIWPRWRMWPRPRAVIFLIATLALAPGLLANVVLKDNWGRTRPIFVTEFGGPGPFLPWWDPRGECRDNCSFVGGEAAGAFWMLAPAALAPPQWRPFAYATAVAFGAGVGLVRIAFGGHFFTDVAFAGVFTFLVIWLVHGLLYRWRPTRLRDAAIEQPLERLGLALRRLLGGSAERPPPQA
jgi:membrane-associated PAP2 superfamily phosphatase